MTGTAPVKRVLIVEDDQDVRGALAAFLEGEGHSVVEAAHGAEALTRLHDSDGICLIVLDLWMPVMDGWEFRAAQRKDPTLAAVPVVVITADKGAEQRAADFGEADWMTKPIDFGRLLELVHAHC
ncbi:MAG: response regulator [Deltaproteobacteria bacterium]|nr:MAG: response regulator [Deltaproteobacteria bacterium]